MIAALVLDEGQPGHDAQLQQPISGAEAHPARPIGGSHKSGGADADAQKPEHQPPLPLPRQGGQSEPASSSSATAAMATAASNVVSTSTLRRAARELPDRVTRDDLEGLLGQNLFDERHWKELLVGKFGHDTCAPGSYTYTGEDQNVPWVRVQYVAAVPVIFLADV